MSDQQWLADFKDRHEIEECLKRYSTAIDTQNFELLDTVFVPEADVDYRPAGGIQGNRAEVKEWLAKTLVMFATMQHSITNICIELDGDRASSVCNLFNPMGIARKDGGMDVFFCGGCYRDELVRTEEGWRITSRLDDVTYFYGDLPKGIDIPK